MAEMYRDVVKTTASDKEPWRVLRLQRVIGYVQALMDKDGDGPFLNKIKKLHDHEGILTVYWKAEPRNLDKKFIRLAWESVIGDGSDNVEHVAKK